MQKYLLFLFLIILIGLFFRTYQIVERFEFAADGDLYSWVVKDIVINHHFRLIGQLTSAEGIFVGPFFYYLLIPFFLITKMDPVGVTALGVIIGILTSLSYYFVLSKLFNKIVGLVAAFLHSILISTINFDRWIVPTLPTKLWTIWYFYTIFMITRGNFSVLPILGVLIGLIWHIHIALIPTLLAAPIAIYISKKVPSKKQITLFFISLVITSLPLILFEVRHNFQQFFSLIENFARYREGPTGFSKLSLVLGMIIQNTNSLFFSPHSFKLTNNIFFVFLILISPLLIKGKEFLSLKYLTPIYFWIFGVILFFSISSSPVSEYYFSNLEVIFVIFVSLLISILLKRRNTAYIILTFLLFVFLKNAYFFTSQDIYHKGYVERKALVQKIKQDTAAKNFPCIGITYITSPGENVGFRHFFYLSNIHLVHPSLDVPVYNIVIPEELSSEVKQRFGHIGLIPPTNIPSKEVIEKSCQTPNTNLTDPMLGYVE